MNVKRPKSSTLHDYVRSNNQPLADAARPAAPPQIDPQPVDDGPGDVDVSLAALKPQKGQTAQKKESPLYKKHIKQSAANFVVMSHDMIRKLFFMNLGGRTPGLYLGNLVNPELVSHLLSVTTAVGEKGRAPLRACALCITPSITACQSHQILRTFTA